jgi:hypothetical protein
MTEKKTKSKTKTKSKSKPKSKAKESKIIIENIINVARPRGGGKNKKLNERNKGLEYNYTTFLPRQQPNIIQYQEPQTQLPPPPPPPPRLNNDEALIREIQRIKNQENIQELARPYIEQRNILERKRFEDNENIKKSYMERLPTLPKDYYEEMEEKKEVMDNQARELIEQLNQEKPVRKTSIPPLEDLPQPLFRRNIRLIKRTNSEEI